MRPEPLDYARPAPPKRRRTHWIWHVVVIFLFFFLWFVVLPLWYTWSMRDF